MIKIGALAWGVFVLLHPFILRLSGAPLGPAPKQAFSYLLSGGSFMRLGKDSFFMFSVPILFIFASKVNQIPNYLKIFFAAIIGIGFLFQKDFLFPVAFYQSIFLCLGVIFFLTLYQSLTSEVVRVIESAFSHVALVGAFWVFLEYFGLKPYGYIASLMSDKISYKSTHGAGYVSGFLNHPNMTGAYLAFCIPFFIRKNQYFIFVIMAAIFLLNSALPMITAISIVLYYVFTQASGVKSWPFLAVVSFGIFAYFTGLGGLDNERFLIWGEYLKQFHKNYFLGHGLGFFGDHFSLAFPDGSNLGRARHEHSEWLALFSTYGFIGIGLVVNVFKKALRAPSPIYASGLFGVLVNCYGNHPFHLTTLAVPCFYFFAVCLLQSEGLLNDEKV